MQRVKLPKNSLSKWKETFNKNIGNESMEIVIGFAFIAAIGFVMVRKFKKANSEEKDCCK